MMESFSACHYNIFLSFFKEIKDLSACHSNLTPLISSLCQAIKDLTKALEFDPNSADVLHERGNLFNPALS